MFSRRDTVSKIPEAIRPIASGPGIRIQTRAGIPMSEPGDSVTENTRPTSESRKRQTGQSLLRQYVMPYIQLRVAGNLTKEQKQEIAAQFTKTLEEVAGKPPAATYIVIEGVSRDNWAKGGKLLSDS